MYKDLNSVEYHTAFTVNHGRVLAASPTTTAAGGAATKNNVSSNTAASSSAAAVPAAMPATRSRICKIDRQLKGQTCHGCGANLTFFPLLQQPPPPTQANGLAQHQQQTRRYVSFEEYFAKEYDAIDDVLLEGRTVEATHCLCCGGLFCYKCASLRAPEMPEIGLSLPPTATKGANASGKHHQQHNLNKWGKRSGTAAAAALALTPTTPQESLEAFSNAPIFISVFEDEALAHKYIGAGVGGAVLPTANATVERVSNFFSNIAGVVSGVFGSSRHKRNDKNNQHQHHQTKMSKEEEQHEAEGGFYGGRGYSDDGSTSISVDSARTLPPPPLPQSDTAVRSDRSLLLYSEDGQTLNSSGSSVPVFGNGRGNSGRGAGSTATQRPSSVRQNKENKEESDEDDEDDENTTTSRSHSVFEHLQSAQFRNRPIPLCLSCFAHDVGFLLAFTLRLRGVYTLIFTSAAIAAEYVRLHVPKYSSRVIMHIGTADIVSSRFTDDESERKVMEVILKERQRVKSAWSACSRHYFSYKKHPSKKLGILCDLVEAYNNTNISSTQQPRQQQQQCEVQSTLADPHIFLEKQQAMLQSLVDCFPFTNSDFEALEAINTAHEALYTEALVAEARQVVRLDDDEIRRNFDLIPTEEEVGEGEDDGGVDNVNDDVPIHPYSSASSPNVHGLQSSNSSPYGSSGRSHYRMSYGNHNSGGSSSCNNNDSNPLTSHLHSFAVVDSDARFAMPAGAASYINSGRDRSSTYTTDAHGNTVSANSSRGGAIVGRRGANNSRASVIAPYTQQNNHDDANAGFNGIDDYHNNNNNDTDNLRDHSPSHLESFAPSSSAAISSTLALRGGDTNMRFARHDVCGDMVPSGLYFRSGGGAKNNNKAKNMTNGRVEQQNGEGGDEMISAILVQHPNNDHHPDPWVESLARGHFKTAAAYAQAAVAKLVAEKKRQRRTKGALSAVEGNLFFSSVLVVWRSRDGCFEHTFIPLLQPSSLHTSDGDGAEENNDHEINDDERRRGASKRKLDAMRADAIERGIAMLLESGAGRGNGENRSAAADAQPASNPPILNVSYGAVIDLCGNVLCVVDNNAIPQPLSPLAASPFTLVPSASSFSSVVDPRTNRLPSPGQQHRHHHHRNAHLMRESSIHSVDDGFLMVSQREGKKNKVEAKHNNPQTKRGEEGNVAGSGSTAAVPAPAEEEGLVSTPRQGQRQQEEGEQQEGSRIDSNRRQRRDTDDDFTDISSFSSVSAAAMPALRPQQQTSPSYNESVGYGSVLILDNASANFTPLFALTLRAYDNQTASSSPSSSSFFAVIARECLFYAMTCVKVVRAVTQSAAEDAICAKAALKRREKEECGRDDDSGEEKGDTNNDDDDSDVLTGLNLRPEASSSSSPTSPRNLNPSVTFYQTPFEALAALSRDRDDTRTCELIEDHQGNIVATRNIGHAFPLLPQQDNKSPPQTSSAAATATTNGTAAAATSPTSTSSSSAAINAVDVLARRAGKLMQYSGNVAISGGNNKSNNISKGSAVGGQRLNHLFVVVPMGTTAHQQQEGGNTARDPSDSNDSLPPSQQQQQQQQQVPPPPPPISSSIHHQELVQALSTPRGTGGGGRGGEHVARRSLPASFSASASSARHGGGLRSSSATAGVGVLRQPAQPRFGAQVAMMPSRRSNSSSTSTHHHHSRPVSACDGRGEGGNLGGNRQSLLMPSSSSSARGGGGSHHQNININNNNNNLFREVLLFPCTSLYDAANMLRDYATGILISQEKGEDKIINNAATNSSYSSQQLQDNRNDNDDNDDEESDSTTDDDENENSVGTFHVYARHPSVSRPLAVKLFKAAMKSQMLKAFVHGHALRGGVRTMRVDGEEEEDEEEEKGVRHPHHTSAVAATATTAVAGVGPTTSSRSKLFGAAERKRLRREAREQRERERIAKDEKERAEAREASRLRREREEKQRREAEERERLEREKRDREIEAERKRERREREEARERRAACLECPICMESYTLDLRRPCVCAACGNSFCLVCALRLHDCCSFCRAPLPTSDHGGNGNGNGAAANTAANNNAAGGGGRNQRSPARVGGGGSSQQQQQQTRFLTNVALMHMLQERQE